MLITLYFFIFLSFQPWKSSFTPLQMVKADLGGIMVKGYMVGDEWMVNVIGFQCVESEFC